ncbi:hypothetical protein AERO9A_400004 [Aeromonas salmonicida]|nr:hypothetical protein AERO9A_400004 [Aeromonas salmonicida]
MTLGFIFMGKIFVAPIEIWIAIKVHAFPYKIGVRIALRWQIITREWVIPIEVAHSAFLASRRLYVVQQQTKNGKSAAAGGPESQGGATPAGAGRAARHHR